MNENESQSARLEKGERVECVAKGQTYYGAILRGGAGKVTMMIDATRQTVSGPVSCFKRSERLAPADPVSSDADHWSMIDFKPFHGRDDCVAFEATLCFDGEPYLKVYNNGTGDGDKFTPIGQRSLMDVARFHAAGKAWGAANGAPELRSLSHLWMVWYVDKRPFGIPSAEFLKEIAAKQR